MVQNSFSSPTIAIVGGGIAGLTLALCLENQGFRVLVLEQAREPAEVGAGIQLSPNALKLLFNLDLGDALTETACAPDCIEINDGLSGKPLTRFDLGAETVRRYGAPYLVLHRADLLSVLLNSCLQKPDIELLYRHHVTDIDRSDDGLAVKINAGEETEKEITVDAVVGADGVWSNVRELIPGAAKPQFSGLIAWRGLMDPASLSVPLPLNSTSLWLGPDASVITYPIRQGKAMNLVAITRWTEKAPPPYGWLEGDSIESSKKQRLLAFKKWDAPIKTLLANEGNWGGWPLFGVSSVGTIANGPICLTGDAAHPMLPFGAQGGGCAIEDAAVLAACCKKYPQNLTKAFSQYEKMRKQRQQKVVEMSASNGRTYHMSFPANIARNIAMKSLSQNQLQNRMKWLYGWTFEPEK